MCVPQYSIINVTGQATADNCAAEVQKVQKSSNGVEVVNNVTVLLRNGPSTITQKVFDSSTRAEGEISIQCPAGAPRDSRGSSVTYVQFGPSLSFSFCGR